MKKLFVKFMCFLLALFAFPLTGAAETLTVGNGTNSDAYVPLYGSYMDESGTYSQTIYSSTMLSSLAGQKITQISYYPTAALSNNLKGDVVKISLKEVDQDGFESTTPITDMTQCGTCTIAGGESQLVFVLDNPFIYSGNKNLAIEVHMVSKGSGSGWASGMEWYYETTSGNVQTSLYHYSSTTSRNYQIPKTSFTYELATTDPTITAGTLETFNAISNKTTASQTLNVRGANLTGDITATITGTNDGFFSVSPASLGTSGGDLTITYTPTAVGEHTATLTLSSTGAEDVEITLNGNAEAPTTSGTVTPTSLTFNTYAEVAATQTITIENTGNQAFTPVFAGIAAPFSIEAATEIAVGASKTFTVTYTPTAVGTHTGSFTVTIGEQAPVTVTLNGTATEAPKEVTIAEDGTPISSNNMSPIPVEGSYFDTQGTYGQTIYKKSDLALLAGKNITKVKYYSNTTFDATKIGGVVLEIYMTETENSEMPLGGLTFSGSAVGEYVIQGGEKEVEFNLTEPFSYSGDNNLAVQVRVKTAKSWHNISWIGKIISSEWVSYYKYGSYSGRSTTLPKTTFSYSDNDTPATPVITVDPATVDAFTTEVGTPVTATVNVSGENLTDAITATISGDNADCFTAALENGVLTITYNPTAAGNHTATLTLSSTGAEDVTIALTGTATAPAYAVTVNPENGYDFGNVLVDNTKAWTITVTNNGTQSVTPTLTGLEAPFSTNYTAAPLAAGESVDIEITFAPTVVDEYNNTITISFPEASDVIPNYTYELTGNGVDSFEPTEDNEVVKLVTVDKRSIYVPDFIDTANGNTTPQQLNCYNMYFRMAQLDDPAKQIKAGDLRPGNNLFEYYAIDDFGTEFRFATVNLYAQGQPATSTTSAMDAPITVTPSVEYYTEDGMPVHSDYSHNTTLKYTEKTYNDVNDLVDLDVIDVNDTWSANTATNAHPDHYKFQIRGIGQYGELVTSLTSEYVESHMIGYGNSLVMPEGWERGMFAGPNNEASDDVHTFYYYDLYIKKSFFDDNGITGPVTVVVNTTLSGSGFNADNYKAMSVNGVEQIIAKEEFKDYSWTVPLLDSIPAPSNVEKVPMGVIIRLVSTGADFNRTQYINIYGGGTGVSNVDTVNIYKSSMNVKAYTQKQVDEDTDRNLVAMNAGATSDVNVLAYGDPAVTGYKLYKNTSASTSGMTEVASANHEADGGYSVNSIGDSNGRYPFVRDESLGNIDGMWLNMYPASENEYYLPVTYANGVGDDGVVRSEGNTYGSAMQQVQENGSISFNDSKCGKSNYTWTKDGVTYAIYNPDVLISSSLPGGYQLYKYRLWVDYEDDAPAWDFEKTDGKINLTEKMDRPLYEGTNVSIGGDSPDKETWTFVAPANLTSVKLVARCYYKKASTASSAPVLKARPTDSDRLYYVVESQVNVPTDKIVTGIYNVTAKNVVGVKYYNVQGVESATPFDGINIEVTTYDDGTRTTRKVLR